MKRTRTKFSALILALVMLMTLAPLTMAQEDIIVFGDAGWDSMKFHNAVSRLIVEEAFGRETREVSGSSAITYNGLKHGDIQVYMETWTDSFPTYTSDVEKGELIELGVNYDDNIQGLYVPRYVIEGDEERSIEPMAPDLKNVWDLKDYAEIFQDPEDNRKGRIYGAISGWFVDEIMRKKVEFYGLDEMYNYMDPGSDAALSAAIAGAYKKGEPIVAYYWEPAWITGQYDLVLLEDAPYEPELYPLGQSACPSIRLTVAVNPEFHENNPEISEFLSKYQTSSALTSEALAYISGNNASYEDAAKWFLTQHDDLLAQWLTQEQADIVRAAL